MLFNTLDRLALAFVIKSINKPLANKSLITYIYKEHNISRQPLLYT